MEYIKNIKKSYKLKYNITYYIIIAVVAVMSVMSMTGDLKRSTMGLLARIAYSIIMALSLNLVVGFLGELSLGHGGFMCVGAYIGCFCANFLHNVIGSPLLVLIISMVIGGLSAALSALRSMIAEAEEKQ